MSTVDRDAGFGTYLTGPCLQFDKPKAATILHLVGSTKDDTLVWGQNK